MADSKCGLSHYVDTFHPGGSSGIGKATAQLCLNLGANVVVGDLNPPQDPFENSDKLMFLQVDVTSWESLRNMFVQANERFGRIDHVFANAGVTPTPDFLDVKLDKDGQLEPPNLCGINVNLMGPIYTIHLAKAYMTQLARESTAGSGSIVLAASASACQTFSGGDYTISKHGVLGMIRGLVVGFEGHIRLNAIAPSWTASGIVPPGFLESAGVMPQTSEAVAKSVVLLFVDEKRHGEVIYSWDGLYREINNAKGGLLESAERLLGNAANEERVMRKLVEVTAKSRTQ